MKPLTNSIQRLEKDQKKELARILHSRTTQEKSLVKNMLSPQGMHHILTSLESDELKLFKAIYDDSEEVKNFNTLEKKIHMPVAQIDRHITSLSRKALIYVIKNRQLLTNKMDKVYLLKEVADELHFVTTTELLEELNQLNEAFKESKSAEKPEKIDKAGSELLVHLAEAGGILSFEKITAHENMTAPLEKFLEKGIVRLVHVIAHPEISLILLTPAAVPSLKTISFKSSQDPTISVNNHFRMVLNLLHTYDIISTYGLFLTKQNQIRKIDLKRISDGLIKTRDTEGSEPDSDRLTLLLLYWLHATECIKIKKDTASITLRPLKKDLENPVALSTKLLHALDRQDESPEVFKPEKASPGYRSLTGMLKTLADLRECDMRYLQWTIHSGKLAASGKKHFYRHLEKSASVIEDITETVNLLCLLGMISVEHGVIHITDIGLEVSQRLFKIQPKDSEKEEKPSIYINPDFTLILAENELPSLALYYIMAHTDLENDDVIIHATITRESVIRAQKRGLSLDNFLNTLNRFARNKIPQNLVFLLSEWAKQTMTVTMKRVILMETDHSSFLDEVMYGQKEENLIRRISPNHAIVSRDFIDTLVKKARKKDAVIRLFESEDDDDE